MQIVETAVARICTIHFSEGYYKCDRPNRMQCTRCTQNSDEFYNGPLSTYFGFVPLFIISIYFLLLFSRSLYFHYILTDTESVVCVCVSV